MRKNIFGKNLVVGMIIMFVGAGVIPSIGLNIIKRQDLQIIKTSFEDYNSNSNILYVGGDGPNNYTKIQDTIDNAGDGDTVFVYNGIYNETLEIENSINLIGENKGTTTIDIGGMINSIVNITANWVNISNFTIQNGFTGLFFNSNFNTIEDNNILKNGYGTEYTYGCGIYFNGDNNHVIGNNISNNTWGILGNSSNSTITGNTILNNNWWIFGGGIYLTGENNNIIVNNISNNQGFGIGGSFCNSSIINNTILGNSGWIDSNAIILFSSNYNTIKLNTLNGITLQSYSNNNSITGNNISNDLNGLHFYESCNNITKGNNISNNVYGIYIEGSSSNNTIYHNNVINNQENANDQGNNIWDDGKYGNYWSDYEERYPNATKIKWKGIWNTPYEIPYGKNKGNYPLIKPFNKPRSKMANVLFQNFLEHYKILFLTFQKILKSL